MGAVNGIHRAVVNGGSGPLGNLEGAAVGATAD